MMQQVPRTMVPILRLHIGEDNLREQRRSQENGIHFFEEKRIPEENARADFG